MANCDYKTPVRILNAGIPLVLLVVRCSLSTPRSQSLLRLVRVSQAENNLSFPTARRTTWTAFVQGALVTPVPQKTYKEARKPSTGRLKSCGDSMRLWLHLNHEWTPMNTNEKQPSWVEGQEE
jgi:hypothetical protein